MEMTQLGRVRSLERTKMHPADIVSMLEAGAYVQLGDSTRKRFVLFYSLPDRECKIAVLEKESAQVVDFWERTFRLPPHIERVTSDRERQAERAFKKYVEMLVFGNKRAEDEKKILTAIVNVYVEGAALQQYLFGELPQRKCTSQENVIAHFKETFAAIVAETDPQVPEGAPIEYHILLFAPTGDFPEKRFLVRRKAMHSILALPRMHQP